MRIPWSSLCIALATFCNFAKEVTVKKLLLASLVALLTTQAHADSFTYSCEIVVDLRFETHLVKIDEQTKTLKWRGKTYQITNNPECGKYGWHNCLRRADDSGRDIATER